MTRSSSPSSSGGVQAIELLRELVRFPSVSAASNRAIADYVSQRLADAGAAVDQFTYANEAKVNVLARFPRNPRIGPEPEWREGLVLCGHLDVVPAGPPEEGEWMSEPFTLTEREGKLYGRGACDMKGSIANFLAIVEELDLAKLKAPLVLLLTADEELGSVGAQEFARQWCADGAQREPLPGACIIGEPTSLRAVRMHKGHLKVRITVHGKAGHSGSPHLGVNAIERSAPVLAALSRVRAEWARARPMHHELFAEVPHAVLCPARMHGGDAWNVIPEKCVIECGVRLLPGMLGADAVAEIAEAVGAGVEKSKYRKVEKSKRGAVVDTSTSQQVNMSTGAEVEVEVVNDNPPLLTGADAALHVAVCDELGQRESVGVSYASDGGPLARDFGMECVLFGPGSIEAAHRPNEFVPIAELLEAQRVVRGMVARFCE